MDYALLGEIALYAAASWGAVRAATAVYEDHKTGIMLREKAEAKMLQNGNGAVK
jgi:hypothetical protein